MSYSIGQVVRTSTGKTGVIESVEYWDLDGIRFSHPKEVPNEGKAIYVPYQVRLRNRVVSISHKNLFPVDRINLSVTAEGFRRMERLLASTGVQYSLL